MLVLVGQESVRHAVTASLGHWVSDLEKGNPSFEPRLVTT
jgi:hypothetical protein